MNRSASALAELELSFTSAGVVTYPAGAAYGPRLMNDYEFIWVMDGDAEYTWESTTVAAPAGSILLCRPGGKDVFRCDERKRTRQAFFHFDLRSFPSTWPDPSTWPIVREPESSNVLHPLFRFLLTWAYRDDPTIVELTMANFLWAFVSGNSASRELPEEAVPGPVDRALVYIHDTLAADPYANIPLADMASAGGVTPSHLCRLFKASIGYSPVETVWLVRLDRAASLLASTDLSIQEVAEASGFQNPYHFSRRFKESYGVSPRVLRQAIQNGAAPPAPLLLRWNDVARWR